MKNKKILFGLIFILLFILIGGSNVNAALRKSKPWYNFFPPIEGQPDEVRGVDPIKLRKTVRSWSEKHISTELSAGKRQQRWEGIITPYHISDEVYEDLNTNLIDNSISIKKVENLNQEINGLNQEINVLNQEINGLKEDILALDGGGASTEPGGSNTEIQFNKSGEFAGEEEFRYDYDTNEFSLNNGVANFSDSDTLIRSGYMDDIPFDCSQGEIYIAFDGNEEIYVDGCYYDEDIHVRMYVCDDEGSWRPVVEGDYDACGGEDT